jgi:hypothetical protein
MREFALRTPELGGIPNDRHFHNYSHLGLARNDHFIGG